MVGKKKRHFMTVVFCSAIAAVGMLFAVPLPVSRAPLSRSGAERQPTELKITPFVLNGKTYERVEFVSGTRSLILNGEIGQRPWSQFIRCGTLVVLEQGKSVAELRIAVGSEWSDKGDPENEKLVIDREKRTVNWSRPYKLKDGTQKNFSYAVSIIDDGRLAVDYDFGLPLEEAQRVGQLPLFCRMIISEREDGTLEYGFGGEVYRPYPVDALLAANQRQWNGPLGLIKSNCFEYEKRDPEKHWTLLFPKMSLMKKYTWIDSVGRVRKGKRYRGGMLYGAGRFGDFKDASLENDVKGRFIFDLGKTAMPTVPPQPPVGGIDFWGNDALHVQEPTTRNLIMNGSFEQDFKGWRWADWGAVYTETDLPREEIVEGGKVGRHALLLRGVQMQCPALCSAPLPLVPGETYTVSCWAKAVNGKTAGINFNVRSVANNAKYFQFKGLNEFPFRTVKGPEWQRLSFSFVADAGGFFVQISPGGGCGRDGILIDGIQVEKGKAATDYTEAAFVANLLTSDPCNDLKPGEPINASLLVQSLEGAKGSARVRVFNGYYEQHFDKSFDLFVEKGGVSRLPLDLDLVKDKLGKGVFIVRIDFTRTDAKPGEMSTWTDYTRFIIQEPLANKHATAQLYANHAWFFRVSKAPYYTRKFVEWGWGSTDGGLKTKSPLMPLVRELGIRNYVRPVSYDMRKINEVAQKPLPSGAKAPKQKYLGQTGTPEELELFEVAAYEMAMECDPNDDIWTFCNEEEGWLQKLGDNRYEIQYAFNAAVRRGVQRAFKERGLPPPRFTETHGTSHYFNGRNYDVVENYLKTALKHGYRYDVISIHPYSNIDGSTIGSHDADVETKHLLDTMKKYGYPDSAKIMFTECFNISPFYFPHWGCFDWNDSYRCNTTPSHDRGNREFLMAAAQMRIYILGLKYWPKLQLIHPWNPNPIIDLRFTPLLFTFSANTLGHLLPSPVFVGDAQPYGDVRGYCFRQDDRAIMPVWTTNHDVENGIKKSPIIEMTLPADTSFIDMFGNAREPDAKDVKVDGKTKVVRVPLTPAPLFLVSSDAEGLLKGLREAVADDPSTAFSANVLPNLSGSLELTLENLTKAPREGKIRAGEKEIAYSVGPRESAKYQILKGSTDVMKLQSWRGSLAPIFTKPWETKWFFVPKCGEKPDWSKIPSIPLDNIQGSAKNGFKASCKYAWNKDFLFIRVEAEDPELIDRAEDGKVFSPKCLYAHDGCLEVYFDGFADGRSQGTKGYDLNDSRYDFLGDAVHRFKAVNWQLAQGTASATDEEIREKLIRKFTRTEKGYVYELAFAARYMAPVKLESGTVAGTGICLHEYTRSKDGKFLHASVSDSTVPGITCDQKPWVWPLMILTDETKTEGK